MQGNSDTTAQRQTTQIVRIAWFFTFVLPLILATLLLGVSSAQAAPTLPGLTPLAFEESEGEEEGFEGEFELEACEAAEEELEEGELGEAAVEAACEEEEGEGKRKATGSGSVAPEECLLRSARARAVASLSSHSLKLTVGYTTYQPTAATVDYSARGGKGSLHLGAAKRHLGKSGVIRLSRKLSDGDMTKVQTAGNFSVRLHVAGVPRNCRRFEIERLTVKRVSKRQAVWSQRD